MNNKQLNSEIDQALELFNEDAPVQTKKVVETPTEKGPGTFDSFMEKYWKHILVAIALIMLAIYIYRAKK